MPRTRGGKTPPKPPSRGDARRFLTAYLKAQELHKEVHRLTKAFETNGTDTEITNRLETVDSLLEEIWQLMNS